MSCCGGGKGAVDPKTNKPVVTVSSDVDGTAPTSAAEAAQAYGAQDAHSRLPAFFFTKMPEDEPEPVSNPAGGPIQDSKVSTVSPPGGSGTAATAAARRDPDDDDDPPRRDQGVGEPKMLTPEKQAPQRTLADPDGPYTVAQEKATPPGALPALLQVVQVNGADGQMHYQVVEAKPPPPMQIAA